MESTKKKPTPEQARALELLSGKDIFFLPALPGRENLLS